MADSSNTFAAFLLVYQRDVNRISDSDRNTRKRGLQKLFDDLPWSSKGEKKKNLICLMSSHLIPPLLKAISDPVEKCRDLTLNILTKFSESKLKLLSKIDEREIAEIVQTLCVRIGDIPYQEPSEEIRLKVVELLAVIVDQDQRANDSSGKNVSLSSHVVDTILLALSKSIQDAFPSVKKACADIICQIASPSFAPMLVRLQFKVLIKGLLGNMSHQHWKVRTITLKAIGCCVACISEEYDSTMTEGILPMLSNRVLGENSLPIRLEFARFCGRVLSMRHETTLSAVNSLVPVDGALVCFLLLLMSAESPADLQAEASKNLEMAAQSWVDAVKKAKKEAELASAANMLVEDSDLNAANEENNAELAMQHLTAVKQEASSAGVPMDVVTEEEDVISADTAVTEFLQAKCMLVCPILLEGVSSWTSQSRLLYIEGLSVFINKVTGKPICGTDGKHSRELVTLLPNVIAHLTPTLRDDESLIRLAAERCCEGLGRRCRGDTVDTSLVATPELASGVEAYLTIHDLMDLLLPRMCGEVAGGDTAVLRACAIRCITCVVKGFANAVDTDGNKPSADRLQSLICQLSLEIAKPSLYAFRDGCLMEAIVLLVRMLLIEFPSYCAGSAVQQQVCIALIFLLGRCPGESTVIEKAARCELVKFATICYTNTPGHATPVPDAAVLIEQVVALHYTAVLEAVNSSTSDSSDMETWSSDSAYRATFEALVRLAPMTAWVNHKIIITILAPHIQPPAFPDKDSPAEVTKGYAACRGDETAEDGIIEVNVRLGLMALLEGLIREGSNHWECGKFINEAADGLFNTAIMPNLIWRMGRVESTIRKVTLAACYALLKAGGVKRDILFSTASRLVPALVSNMDDHDVSPRQMSCFCLTIIFDRLKGSFGEQSIFEMYPKLLKRLDDSNDAVRVAVCGTLEVFLQSATNKSCYSSTMLGYTLDQLFIHLDDIDPTIQKAVHKVIAAAIDIDKSLVLKKAEDNKLSHRNPACCDAIIFLANGFEILED